MKTPTMRSSTSRRVNQEKPRLYQAERLNKADEEMNELMITVSMRTEKHCNSSVDTSKRVSRALHIQSTARREDTQIADDIIFAVALDGLLARRSRPRFRRLRALVRVLPTA